MKKLMQASRLMQAGHPEQKTDIGLWKQQRAEYYNSRTEEIIRVVKCLMHYCCKCPAKVRIITDKGYKRLKFYGTHDEKSHAVDYSKTLKSKYNQTVTIHDAVMVALKQSAAVLRRNLMQVKGSPEQHKRMDPSQLRVIYPATCLDCQAGVDQAQTRRCNCSRILGAAWANSLGGARRKSFMSH